MRAALEVEGEAAFGDFAAEHGVADLEFVKMRRKRALRDELNEKFESFLIGRRNDGVSALDAFVFVIHAEGGILAGLKSERAAGINANQPQVFRQIFALDDAGHVVPVRRESHTLYPPSPNLSIGVFKKRPGGAAVCAARWCEIYTLPSARNRTASAKPSSICLRHASV